TKVPAPTNALTASDYRQYLKKVFATNGLTVVSVKADVSAIVLTTNLSKFVSTNTSNTKAPKALPEKAPTDSNWLQPFGPLTTKAAKGLPPAVTYSGELEELPFEEQSNDVGQFRMSTRFGLKTSFNLSTNADTVPRLASLYGAALVNLTQPWGC